MKPLDPYAGVLLDVDGVLVNTERAVLALWAQVCLEVDGRTLHEHDRHHIIGCSVEHSMTHLFPDAGPAEAARVRGLVEALEPGLPVIAVPGAVEFVAELNARSVPVALVTGASRERLDTIVESLGISSHVSAAVTWGEARGKPDAQPYLLAAHRLGLRACDCLVVEDAVAGVRSAVRAGATCIGLSDPGSPAGRALRAAGAEAVLASMREVAAALGLVAEASGDEAAPTDSTRPEPHSTTRSTRGTS